jgi:uncharacterized protein
VVRVPPATAGRRWFLVVAAIIVGLFVAFTALSGFFIDLLWFREVGFSDVFWTILRTKIALGLVFGVAFFALLYVNLLIVRMFTPRYRAVTLEQEIIERYRVQFEPYAWWLLPLIAIVIGAFVGFGVTTQWRTFLLWRNSSGVSFNSPDPLFERDAGFYIFRLPWLEFLQGWLFSSLIGVTFLSAIAHYLWGGIRPQAPALGDKVSPQVKAHLSVLLGLIFLTKAWGYYLGKFDLLTSKRGVVNGASYTDVKAQLPALKLLVFIAIVCAILFLVNIRRRGWALPVIAVGLLGLSSFVVGGAYPAFVQRFRVGPQEFQKEQPYIIDNIDATRAAFNLTNIDVQARTPGIDVTPQDVKANDTTISNIRVWRPLVLKQNFQSLQRIKQYYEFQDVDVDRYDISGQRRVLMLSAREVNQDGIPGGGGTWQNRHLLYTHGYGAVASQVNTATTEGAPQFALSDIPPVGQPVLTTPQIYFGENRGAVPFVVTNTGAQELDYQKTDQTQQTSIYQGTGGIPIGGFFQRALFAWRFKDVNLLISGLIHGDSRIMMYRDIYQRVPKAAPFLKFDGDPYAAIVDGSLVWIWDAYTTSDMYPYSQQTDLGKVTSSDTGAQYTLTGTANYIRNSVKVVVDAYNGSVKYYVSDPNDPIIQVWGNAFPTLFTPMDQATPELQAHFRYPENLFQAQAAQFANYHVTNPTTFYGKQDFWQVSGDPTIQVSEGGTPPPIRPYYLLMRLPGETTEQFVLILPFSPQGRLNMVAWMAARSDPGSSYGQMISYEFPSGVNVDGPSQVFSRMNQDQRFSEQRTLLGQAGSTIDFGDFLVIPVADALLYVQPVYVSSAQNAIPELKLVLVGNGDTVGVGNTLRQALVDSYSGQVPGGGGGGPTPGGSVQEQIAALIKQAADHFAAADQALKAGNLALYQTEVNAARDAIAAANQLASQLTGPTPAPSVTPSATPSASP